MKGECSIANFHKVKQTGKNLFYCIETPLPLLTFSYLSMSSENVKTPVLVGGVSTPHTTSHPAGREPPAGKLPFVRFPSGHPRFLGVADLPNQMAEGRAGVAGGAGVAGYAQGCRRRRVETSRASARHRVAVQKKQHAPWAWRFKNKPHPPRHGIPAVDRWQPTNPTATQRATQCQDPNTPAAGTHGASCAHMAPFDLGNKTRHSNRHAGTVGTQESIPQAAGYRRALQWHGGDTGAQTKGIILRTRARNAGQHRRQDGACPGAASPGARGTHAVGHGGGQGGGHRRPMARMWASQNNGHVCRQKATHKGKATYGRMHTTQGGQHHTQQPHMYIQTTRVVWHRMPEIRKSQIVQNQRLAKIEEWKFAKIQKLEFRLFRRKGIWVKFPTGFFYRTERCPFARVAVVF